MTPLRKFRLWNGLLITVLVISAVTFVGLLIGQTQPSWGVPKFLWIPPMFIMIAAIAGLVCYRLFWPERIVFRDCDVVSYTKIRSNVYDRIGAGVGSMMRRIKITLRIDFFSGNYRRVIAMPQMIPLMYLHTMPEFLMYYAFASMMRDKSEGVDCANTYITDAKYFHKDHKKADPMYAVAFAITRYSGLMAEKKYQQAAEVFRGLKVPDSHKALANLVRFCRAEAEKALGHIKSARGLYANVGRNANNLYIGRNAEFLRTQLLGVAEGTVAEVKELVSEAEEATKRKEASEAKKMSLRAINKERMDAYNAAQDKGKNDKSKIAK